MKLRIYQPCSTRFVLMLLSLFLLSSCAQTKVNNTAPIRDNTLVIDYQAFGPPQLSSSLVGENYWQWYKQAPHRVEQYDIKVVVFRNMPLDIVKKRYPVNVDKKLDFRYVEYSKAIAWSKKLISQTQASLEESIAVEHDQEGILYDFYRLENLYKLSLKIERGLRN